MLFFFYTSAASKCSRTEKTKLTKFVVVVSAGVAVVAIADAAAVIVDVDVAVGLIFVSIVVDFVAAAFVILALLVIVNDWNNDETNCNPTANP